MKISAVLFLLGISAQTVIAAPVATPEPVSVSSLEGLFVHKEPPQPPRGDSPTIPEGDQPNIVGQGGN
jgi:hypothetical protein